MFTVGSKVKVAISDVLHGVGPCTGSTGYVGRMSRIFLPTFGYIQEFTIFFDMFGKKGPGSRCERKRVLNIIPFAGTPEKCAKVIQTQGKEIDKLITVTTDREDAAGSPKVLLVPAKQTNLAAASALEQICWLKSVLYAEENKYFVLDWLSREKGPVVIADNDLFKNFNDFMMLTRNSQIQLLQEKFPQMLRAYRMVIATSEVETPIQLKEVNQEGQILNKLQRNGLLLKSSLDEITYRGMLLQFCCSPQIYKYIKDTTRNSTTVSGRSTGKIIKEVDQWKEALDTLN